LVTTKRKKAYQKKRKRSKAALDISFHCKKAIQNAILTYFSLTFSQISQFVGSSPSSFRPDLFAFMWRGGFRE
jgi:hypothetical protein